jgi:tRNA modification GTPase
MPSPEPTIVAVATPPGQGGVAIVRLSGPEAESLLRNTFRFSSPSRPIESHRLYYGRLYSPFEDAPIDEVMIVLMRAPRSYTREDVVEVHCHGGSLVVRRVLDLYIDLGARLARPGEFTLRAFLNGRIDLAQAEAVIDLVAARSELSGQVALQQMEGRLSSEIHRLRDAVVELLVPVEAYIDFPEEEIDLSDMAQILNLCSAITSDIGRLLSSFSTGRTLREGLGILLLGRPNVGKSSLLNALLGEARAIVTPIPGTTRDTLEEQLLLDGFPLRLIDSAGVRLTDDPIEGEGVRRAKEKIRTSDLVLLVLDGSTPPSHEDLYALEICRDSRVLLVLNKSDLPPFPLSAPFSDYPVVSISALKGDGLDELRRSILSPFTGGLGEGLREETLITNSRHREALVRASEGMGRFSSAAKDGASMEFLAFELRTVLESFGEITGETAPDEVLDRIFSRFCIGK